MRVPHSPITLRCVMPVSSAKTDDEDSSGNESNDSPRLLRGTRPPRPGMYTSKCKDGKYTVGLDMTKREEVVPVNDTNKEENNNIEKKDPMGGGFHRSRERTRISAVQRLVERKLAQKEKERLRQREKEEKDRRNPWKRSASSHGSKTFGSARRTDEENEYLASLLSRTSRSCERPIDLSGDSKTYITITAGKPVQIREASPSKRPNLTEKTSDDSVSSGNTSNSGYSSEEEVKSVKFEKKPEFTFITENLNKARIEGIKRPERKTSYTTERTFQINHNPRRISLDISVVVNDLSPSPDAPVVDESKQRCNPSPNLSGQTGSSSSSGFSSSGSCSSSGSSTDISSIGSSTEKDLRSRRISLEQRFRARTVKPTVFPQPAPEPQPRRQRKTSSRLFAAGVPHNVGGFVSSESGASSSSPDVSEPRVRPPQLGRAGGYRFHKTTSFQGIATGFKHSQRKFSQESLPPRASSPRRRKISLPATAKEKAKNISSAETISEELNPFGFTKDSTESQADQKKEEGNQLYKTKNYREALLRYSEAIELSPQTPAFYGNRAACHMMLTQYPQALEDARSVIQLDADFVKGYVRVAKCCIALGDVVSAEQAINQALTLEPGSTAIMQEKNAVEQLKKFRQDADRAIATQDFRKALFCLDRAMSIAVASKILKVARAGCLAYLGRYGEAQEVANDLLRSDSMNAEAIYVRGLCLYYEDNVDKAFQHFQQVLRLAPDHKKAKEIYKKAKLLKVKKEEGNEAFKAGKLIEAHALYSEALSIDQFNKFTNAKLYFNRATVAAKLKRLEDSVKDCTSALELDENYFKAILRRAKSYMDLENYEEAVRDYESAQRMERGNHEVRQLLQQAKIQLKQSKRKDYYKILGVERGANDDEIKKAYRKRALVHHPDRHSSASEDERKEHERKFKEVGEAYGVLSDTKKRSRYDNGHDIDDLEGGHGFGGEMDPNHIFQHFFGGAGGMRSGQSFSFGGQNPGGFTFQFG